MYDERDKNINSQTNSSTKHILNTSVFRSFWRKFLKENLTISKH